MAPSQPFFLENEPLTLTTPSTRSKQVANQYAFIFNQDNPWFSVFELKVKLVIALLLFPTV